jgi:phage-related protein
MATFTFIPDQGVSPEYKARVNKAQFGDGYAQSVGEGINTVLQTWKLSFTLRRKTEVQAIIQFLADHYGAVKFTWTTPLGETLSFVCDQWSASGNHDLDWSVSATFEQRY